MTRLASWLCLLLGLLGAGCGRSTPDLATEIQGRWLKGNEAWVMFSHGMVCRVDDRALVGSYAVLDDQSNVLPRIDAVKQWLGTKTPEQVLDAEKAAWASWHTPLPSGLSALEDPLYRQQMAILRMGQVREPGKGDGQILASLPPGNWNISWVRDMAYAVAALAKSGHASEAKRAIEFQLNADSGKYESYVGKPYQISITRYFGDGVEETDSNENGPNIEFDGFGLFLWELGEYVQASKDETSLKAWWPVVSEKVGDVLLALQEQNGLIAKDSSIWEVHWNGQEKHFAYTTLTAATGLCWAASLAEKVGDGARATEYRAAGKKAQAALISQLSAPTARWRRAAKIWRRARASSTPPPSRRWASGSWIRRARPPRRRSRR